MLLLKPNVGAMYEFGRGVEQDYVQAALWYEKAAYQKDASGLLNLALCYLYGRGKPISAENAVYYFTQAAELGDAEAQHNLGLCYQHGVGVDQDWQKAVYWYQQSMQQDYAPVHFSFWWLCMGRRGHGKKCGFGNPMFSRCGTFRII